jgi:hypothetical protein
MPVGVDVLVGWDVAVGVGSAFPQPTSRVRRIITAAIWRAVRLWTIRPIQRVDIIFSFSSCYLSNMGKGFAHEFPPMLF